MKKQKREKNLKKIIPYYKKHYKLIVLIFFLIAIYTGLSFLVPILEGNIIALFTKFNAEKIIKTAAILLATVLFYQIIIHCWSKCVIRLNSSVNLMLKHDMMKNVLSLTINNFDKVNSGIYVSRINKDTSVLSEFFDEITDDMSTIILGIGIMIYAFLVNPYIAMFIVVNIFCVFLITSFALKKVIVELRKFKNEDDELIGSYSEIVRGVRDIKNLNAESQVIGKVDVMQEETVEAYNKYINTRRTWNRLRDCVSRIFDFGFVAISVLLILEDLMSVENFLVLTLYRREIKPILNSINGIREKAAVANVSSKRVFEIIENDIFPKEKFGTKELLDITGKIEFKNVEFLYEDKPLFSDLTFSIKPNSTVAFVGKSGEGKTTILSLISKNYELKSGQILVDDIDITTLTKQSLRKNISVVPQYPYIFNLSFKENLKLAKEDATDDEIIEACKKANLHEFIVEREKGYDTIIGENGVQISGGQRQRLAIARALIKQSKIIIFDEATSSLDNESQEVIKKVIKQLSKDHTIILVAHRLSTVIDADEIMVVNNHKVEAKGTHKQLIKSCEIYKTLYLNKE